VNEKDETKQQTDRRNKETGKADKRKENWDSEEKNEAMKRNNKKKKKMMMMMSRRGREEEPTPPSPLCCFVFVLVNEEKH
jgi:hypothetical protein